VLSILIGSVLISRKVIERARVSNAVTEFVQMKKAISVFKDTYNLLPGDLNQQDASIFPDLWAYNAVSYNARSAQTSSIFGEKSAFADTNQNLLTNGFLGVDSASLQQTVTKNFVSCRPSGYNKVSCQQNYTANCKRNVTTYSTLSTEVGSTGSMVVKTLPKCLKASYRLQLRSSDEQFYSNIYSYSSAQTELSKYSQGGYYWDEVHENPNNYATKSYYCYGMWSYLIAPSNTEYYAAYLGAGGEWGLMRYDANGLVAGTPNIENCKIDMLKSNPRIASGTECGNYGPYCLRATTYTAYANGCIQYSTTETVSIKVWEPTGSSGGSSSISSSTVEESQTFTGSSNACPVDGASDTSANGTQAGVKKTNWTLVSVSPTAPVTQLYTGSSCPAGWSVSSSNPDYVESEESCPAGYELVPGSTPRVENSVVPIASNANMKDPLIMSRIAAFGGINNGTTITNGLKPESVASIENSKRYNSGNGRIEMLEACYSMRMMNSTGFIFDVPDHDKGIMSACDYTDINPNGNFGNLTKKSKISKEVGIFVADSTFYSDQPSDPNYVNSSIGTSMHQGTNKVSSSLFALYPELLSGKGGLGTNADSNATNYYYNAIALYNVKDLGVAAVSASVAKQIDSKIDDGKPYTGFLIAGMTTASDIVMDYSPIYANLKSEKIQNKSYCSNIDTNCVLNANCTQTEFANATYQTDSPTALETGCNLLYMVGGR
jgi:hypothetical protein